MTTRKHNEFLDAPSDEDNASVRGYESEENVAESKGRAVKKRRTDTHDFFGLGSDEEESADEQDEEESGAVKGKGLKQLKTTKRDTAPGKDEEAEAEDDEHDEDEDGNAYLDTTTDEKKKPSKVLSTKLLKKPKKDKSGVVYLSSLPPYLKPLVAAPDMI
jgi:ESF2/ABP1 family protein